MIMGDHAQKVWSLLQKKSGLECVRSGARLHEGCEPACNNERNR